MVYEIVEYHKRGDRVISRGLFREKRDAEKTLESVRLTKENHGGKIIYTNWSSRSYDGKLESYYFIEKRRIFKNARGTPPKVNYGLV